MREIVLEEEGKKKHLLEGLTSVHVAFFLFSFFLIFFSTCSPATTKKKNINTLTVPHPSPSRDRAPRLGRVQQVLPEEGRVLLRGLWRQALRSRDQVRLRVRLAGVLPRGRGVAHAPRGHLDGHEARRGPVRDVRRAPGAHLPGGRVPDADQREALHQLEVDRLQGGGGEQVKKREREREFFLFNLFCFLFLFVITCISFSKPFFFF